LQVKGLWSFYLSGTGSYPDVPPGRHRQIRLTLKTNPRKIPCFLIASIAYSEHVGSCLQLSTRKGERQSLYSL